MSDRVVCDVVVIGAGMAGASIGALLADGGKSVIVVERETMPGYHTTGRSVAVFSEIYGNETVRALTRASRSFLLSPPPGFADGALVRRRGCLFVAGRDSVSALAEFQAQPDVAKLTRRSDADDVVTLCPILRREGIDAALYEPDAADIDVNALHHGYLRLLQSSGGRLATGVTIKAVEFAGSQWIVRTAEREYAAPIVVNAAGAWADDIAAQAGVPRLHIEPRRRTVVAIDLPKNEGASDWPMVVDIAETFYFKPDAGSLLVSPGDESLSPPCDCQPEEVDVAIAVDRFEHATTLRVGRIRRKWAGLRTFAPDRSPLVGFDPSREGFFWFAGQGGFGIQMAPALARLGAALLLEATRGTAAEAFGVDARDVSPARQM